jgi:hypothetical protein
MIKSRGMDDKYPVQVRTFMETIKGKKDKITKNQVKKTIKRFKKSFCITC